MRRGGYTERLQTTVLQVLQISGKSGNPDGPNFQKIRKSGVAAFPKKLEIRISRMSGQSENQDVQHFRKIRKFRCSGKSGNSDFSDFRCGNPDRLAFRKSGFVGSPENPEIRIFQDFSGFLILQLQHELSGELFSML